MALGLWQWAAMVGGLAVSIFLSVLLWQTCLTVHVKSPGLLQPTPDEYVEFLVWHVRNGISQAFATFLGFFIYVCLRNAFCVNCCCQESFRNRHWCCQACYKGLRRMSQLLGARWDGYEPKNKLHHTSSEEGPRPTFSRPTMRFEPTTNGRIKLKRANTLMSLPLEMDLKKITSVESLLAQLWQRLPKLFYMIVVIVSFFSFWIFWRSNKCVDDYFHEITVIVGGLTNTFYEEASEALEVLLRNAFASPHLPHVQVAIDMVHDIQKKLQEVHSTSGQVVHAMSAYNTVRSWVLAGETFMPVVGVIFGMSALWSFQRTKEQQLDELNEGVRKPLCKQLAECCSGLTGSSPAVFSSNSCHVFVDSHGRVAAQPEGPWYKVAVHLPQGEWYILEKSSLQGKQGEPVRVDANGRFVTFSNMTGNAVEQLTKFRTWMFTGTWFKLTVMSYLFWVTLLFGSLVVTAHLPLAVVVNDTCDTASHLLEGTNGGDTGILKCLRNGYFAPSIEIMNDGMYALVTQPVIMNATQELHIDFNPQPPPDPPPTLDDQVNMLFEYLKNISTDLKRKVDEREDEIDVSIRAINAQIKACQKCPVPSQCSYKKCSDPYHDQLAGLHSAKHAVHRLRLAVSDVVRVAEAMLTFLGVINCDYLKHIFEQIYTLLCSERKAKTLEKDSATIVKMARVQCAVTILAIVVNIIAQQKIVDDSEEEGQELIVTSKGFRSDSRGWCEDNTLAEQSGTESSPPTYRSEGRAALKTNQFEYEIALAQQRRNSGDSIDADSMSHRALMSPASH